MSPNSQKNYTLIDSAEAIKTIAEILEKEKIISFDTEFIRESTFFPVFEILQISTRDQVWLIDAAAFKKKPGIEPIWKILENTKILKILHAAQADQECLFTNFGITAKNTLDTAVAAALSGYGDGMGLGPLLKLVLDVRIKKGHARTNWSKRPLQTQLLEYAAGDVLYLVELGEKLISKLEELGRMDWALELSSVHENEELYKPNPVLISEKLCKSGKIDSKHYPVLVALVEWRENRVRKVDVPRRRIAEDSVLVSLAQVCPKDMEHLSSFRGINRGEIKNSGSELLAIIRDNFGRPGIEPPKKRKNRIPSAQENRAHDLLRCYLGVLANQHSIAARYLLASHEMMALIQSDSSDPEVWIEAGIMSRGAGSLIGSEIQNFLSGKVVLSVEGHPGNIKVLLKNLT